MTSLATLAMLAPHAAAAAADNSQWITRLFMGAAALVGAFTAYRVSRRDSNADALKDAVADLRSAKTRIDDLEADVIALRNYGFLLREAMADRGMPEIAPPVLRSERS